MNRREVSKRELSEIFSLAHQNYVTCDLQKKDLNNQQFVTWCYVQAAAKLLGVDFVVSDRIIPESIEE